MRTENFFNTIRQLMSEDTGDPNRRTEIQCIIGQMLATALYGDQVDHDRAYHIKFGAACQSLIVAGLIEGNGIVE
jgi:hypothetical protein